MDLQKNHKNETVNLIKKHEQMDGKITGHETKHEKQIKDLNGNEKWKKKFGTLFIIGTKPTT